MILGFIFGNKKCPKRYVYSVFWILNLFCYFVCIFFGTKSVRNVTYIVLAVILEAKEYPKRYVYSVFCDWGVILGAKVTKQKVSETLCI